MNENHEMNENPTQSGLTYACMSVLSQLYAMRGTSFQFVNFAPAIL
jgi:hypothetical protein